MASDDQRFSTGARQASDNPKPYGILAVSHDNGDRLGSAFSSLRRFSPAGEDHVTVETDEFSDKVWQVLDLSLPIAGLDCNVLSLDVAELA